MKKVLCVFLSLIMILSLAPASVFAASTGASESYALSITNKPGTTFVLSQGEYTSDVCDLWKEIDSDGTGELKFDQSFSININDAVEVYNNFIDTQYPDGDREHYKALEDNNNGAIFYVQARVLINDYEYQFSSKASYMYAPYGLDGEYNEGCGEWNISSYYDDLSEFFTMSKDGGVLNLSLDGTVKEIYEALKAQDEALGDVTINNLEFELRVSCEVEYTGSYGSTNYTELGFDGLSHTLYDKHIYGSTSEYDSLSVVPVTAPLTVNVGPMYEDCYEPVQTEYSWYYEFVKEGYDSDEDETWYGYFEKDESKKSDVLTETAPSGTIYGLAYGTVDSGENNSIMLSDILNEDNKAFINSFIGEKPRELGGKGQMSIVCAVTLTFEDGKQWVVYITKADYMSRLIIPCMHACTVCGLCTVTDEKLPCNFDQMSYDISNVCICEEPSVPEFSYETVHEEETTIESTDTTVKVVVEKIEVEETPTHSFIINTTDAVGVDNVIGLYNINVFNEEGYPYTLNQYYDEGEELTVSVPVSMEEALALQNGEAALYHILPNGTAEEVEGVTVVIDGESATMTFTSDSFSPYVVARTATTYTVTVTGGTASPAGPNAEGTEVTVTADPDPEGKKFKEWQIEGLSTTTSESRSIFFYMPANNVTITAIYEDANIIIESASATITEPVVGANPDFNIVSADESKYTVTVVKWNLLDGSSYPVLTADDKFERGESYQLDVKFVANPGYEFSDSCVYNVNGVSRAAYSLTKGERRCYFDVYEIIDTINVKGVVAPVAGATPDVSGITSDTDGINVIDVKWRDKDGYAFEGNPFVAGEKYILWLKYETESDYKVADDAEVTFNISDSNILDKEITHPIIKMTYEVPADTTYTVSFDANSGTGTMTPVTGISGEYELPACTFTAPSGKQFKAWSVGGSEKAVGDKITVTADTTVTAVWENVSEYTKKGDISAVEATAVLPPVLGATTYTSVPITDPTDAAAKGVRISGTSWYKKDASSIYGWTQCSNGVDTFEEGTYRLEVQLRSESNDAKEYHAMSDETTFTVNGVQWSGKELFRDYYASSGYGYRFFVSPEFTLGGKTLDSIAVTTPPTKTAYREGEDFNPAGMVVTATYTDSSTAPVILYTVTDGTDMAAGKTSVTISYTEGGVTETTTQPITVAKEYIVTVNGGTGNGEYIAGEEVSISAFVSTGMQFKEWQGTDGLTFTSGDKNSQTATFTMPAHDVTVTAVTGPAEYYVSVTGGSGTGMYEAGTIVTIVADAPEAGKQFKEWSVGDGKVLRFTESDITSSTAKFIMPGEAVRIGATYEDIPATKTPIDTVNISDLAKPVVSEMPNNSITVTGTGVTVDDEGSYWGRFVSPSFSPVYDDDTAVDSVVFREGETYMFQLYLNAAAGYEFTADSKFYFASDLLPAPDMTDLSKSFAMVNPSDSTQAVIYINMNDIAHIHVPGDWNFNDTHHWRKCTASGCDAGADVSRLPDYAEHSFVNGLCTCGAHKHSWSADWSVNETHHWHECSANGCTVTDNSGKDGYAAHDFTAGACVCGVENVITSIVISGITTPVAGETPINSASVDKIGAEVDEENTFWVRYDASTGRTGDTYADGTSVHDTPFRDGEIYLLQITIKPKTGYSFTADTKLLYGGAELSAPDTANPTASCGAIAPDYSMAMALINADGTSAPLTYTVTFDANGGSVTPANATTEATGKLATLPTPTRSGSYTFKGWYTASSGGTKITTDTVFDADTTIYAQWNYTGSTGGGGGVSKYTVKFETNGGTTVASKSVTRNAKLEEPTAPTKDGFKFDGWYTDKELKTAYDFDTKVTKSFTLYAKWTEIEKEPENDNPVDTDKWVNPFTDVKENDWFFADVQYVAENNLMNGVAADKFAPNDTLTRAMLVTVLYRNEGEPAVNKSIPFADIDMSAYYANAVIWAQQNGIVNGVSETEFAPNDNITREQIAAIMHRYAQYKGYDVSVGENTNILSYDDFDSISEYAIAAMQYACGSGLMKGKTASTLNPKDNATRAEIAAILHRFIEANK